MAGWSLGGQRSLPAGAVVVVTTTEAAALADLDGRPGLRTECTLARRRGVRTEPAPDVSDFEHLDLLVRTLRAFVRVEVG